MVPGIWEDYEQLIPEADTASFQPSNEGYNASQEANEPLQVAVNEPKQPNIDNMFNGLLSRTDLDDEPFTAEDLAKVEEWQYREEQRLIQIELDRKWRESLRQKIEPYILSAADRLPELRPVIAHKGVIIGSEGNISAVVGEAKSKKNILLHRRSRLTHRLLQSETIWYRASFV